MHETALTAWHLLRLFVDEREKMEKSKVQSEVIMIKGKAMQLKTTNNQAKKHTYTQRKRQKEREREREREREKCLEPTRSSG